MILDIQYWYVKVRLLFYLKYRYNVPSIPIRQSEGESALLSTLAMAPFHERLRELRHAKGWTQEELGRAADLSVFAITKLERGLTAPSWATVKALAKALGVSVQVFEDDEDISKSAGTEEVEKKPRRRGPKKK
jgi:DNA-binding XRE family transcriptional regulator